MKTQNIKSKSGFTIIEVVLVLAIAGLIFMMVFTALPALQRSQRDTQRSEDISRMLSALTNYSGNNRGKIPTKGTVVIRDASGTTDKYTDGTNEIDDFSTDTWAYFYKDYLMVKSAGATDTFEDPLGDPYSINIYKCKDAAGAKSGDECTVGQRYDITFDQQNAGGLDGSEGKSGAVTANGISVVTNASCDGERAVYVNSSRKVAILYKKEGGGVVCVGN